MSTIQLIPILKSTICVLARMSSKSTYFFSIVKIPSTYRGNVRFVPGCKILHQDMAVSFLTRLQT